MPANLRSVLGAATLIIALLVAAQFVTPPEFPWLARQFVLAAIGAGGIALAELLLFGTRGTGLLGRMGFAIPPRRVIAVSLLASIPIWAFLPLVGMVSGEPRIAAGSGQILLGVLLVNGIAEEVIHRAFIFGRAREQWPFWKAASLGAAVFGAQHIYLIATIGWLAGLASITLALLLAFPLSRLFEYGRSIAGPAIVHTSANASFLIFSNPGAPDLLLAHMLVVLLSTYSSFLLVRRND